MKTDIESLVKKSLQEMMEVCFPMISLLLLFMLHIKVSALCRLAVNQNQKVRMD